MKPIGKEKTENEDSSKEAKENSDIITKEKIDFSKVKVEPLFEDIVDFETFSKSDFRAVKVKNCEEVPKSKKLLKFSFDQFIMALDYLYIIGAIKENERGLLCYEVA